MMRGPATLAKGLWEVAVGSYPRFAFGGGLGNILPVFHFHEAEHESFEKKLIYLAENGYRTVIADEIYAFVNSGQSSGPRAVALCFDDAWSSLWTIGLPLLKKYSMRAITYAVPRRLSGRLGLRPNVDQDPEFSSQVDRSDEPFVRKDELKALFESGHVDVQSHTLNHSHVIAGQRIIGYVTPEYNSEPLLRRPYLLSSERHLVPDDLGLPLYAQAPRMDDTPKFFEDAAVFERCREFVHGNGDDAFFRTQGWQSKLNEISNSARTTPESANQAKEAMRSELADSRDALNELLGHDHVKHICFPWGIAGNTAIGMLKKTGYLSAVADKISGFRAARPRQDPYNLMRLHERFIFALPGSGRRYFQLLA